MSELKEGDKVICVKDLVIMDKTCLKKDKIYTVLWGNDHYIEVKEFEKSVWRAKNFKSCITNWKEVLK